MVEQALKTATPPDEAAPAYAYVAAAIRYLEEHQDRQPSLQEVADHIGFSPAHFQRMFSAWVGVSPKKYLSYLTLDHARRLLQERHTVLDATLETGLSSPGRLHDLFVTWEAMSPGVYAAKGAGIEIGWAVVPSPFGPALAMAVGDRLCGLGFLGDGTQDAAFQDLASRWPAATYTNAPETVGPAAMAAFGQGGEARLALIGAPFQIKVWEALLTIPSGHVTTYSDIAERIGSPRAVRAVGTAVGRNPISWLIPCHRAMRKSGGLGGYHWGLGVKRAMLAYESARLEGDAA